MYTYYDTEQNTDECRQNGKFSKKKGTFKKNKRKLNGNRFSSVQSLSCVRLFATPWIAARQASLSITNSWSSLRLMSIESVMPSSHLILCCSLLLLPPIPPSLRARQCIKKQRHHFADKSPYSQDYGLSISHIQMWGLGHEEGRLLKNWWFWAVVLEKTWESLGQQRDQAIQS